jgi:hypothetical protein
MALTSTKARRVNKISPEPCVSNASPSSLNRYNLIQCRPMPLLGESRHPAVYEYTREFTRTPRPLPSPHHEGHPFRP